MGKLLLLFTAVPLIELYLLLLVGRLLGLWPTVAIVLLTGMVGAWLAKSEGLRVLRRWQTALGEGRVPEEGVLDGLLVLVGGVLLVTPGVLTDVLGLALLLPPSRHVIARFVRSRVERKIEQGQIHVVRYSSGPEPPGAAPRKQGRDPVIDADGEEL